MSMIIVNCLEGVTKCSPQLDSAVRGRRSGWLGLLRATAAPTKKRSAQSRAGLGQRRAALPVTSFVQASANIFGERRARAPENEHWRAASRWNCIASASRQRTGSMPSAGTLSGGEFRVQGQGARHRRPVLTPRRAALVQCLGARSSRRVGAGRGLPVLLGRF